MRLIVMLSLFATALAYTDLDDTLSFDDMIADKAVYKDDLDCVIDKKPCSAVFQKYKDKTVEVLSDICNECNDIEKHDLVLFLKAMKEYPDQYKAYKSKYDPTGARISMVEEKLKKYIKKP